MSQSLKFSTAGKIPDSKTVKAFLMSQVPERKRAPIGASVAEGATASGELSLTGLPDNTQLQLAYEESGTWIYPMSVTTPAAKRDGSSSVASANNVTLPNGRVIKVTGTTEIKKIAISEAGTVVTLLFEGVVKVVDGENLKLAGNFESTADDTLSLASDGTNWFEVARSVN